MFVLAASSTTTMVTTVLNLLGSCTLVFVLGLWVALTIWVWRDSHARTTNRRFQQLVTVLVALGFLGGLCIYLLIRPRQTLAHTYQQQVEDEALLAELAERCLCPSCQIPLSPDFRACPTCGSVVKRPCPRCERLLDRHYRFCPWCALALVGQEPQRVPPSPLSLTR